MEALQQRSVIVLQKCCTDISVTCWVVASMTSFLPQHLETLYQMLVIVLQKCCTDISVSCQLLSCSINDRIFSSSCANIPCRHWQLNQALRPSPATKPAVISAAVQLTCSTQVSVNDSITLTWQKKLSLWNKECYWLHIDQCVEPMFCVSWNISMLFLYHLYSFHIDACCMVFLFAFQFSHPVFTNCFVVNREAFPV